ncbi:hypothetical protein BpHYR1_040394 [Brachionus plicatilis]|uniref:Uncharacterized protein n=1 Tax=Brachionus plicatilis TaxID=10195 RepID=A0A3M7PL30_BRAPC|nr:hypothetical protein BpHYR1_040394 [Brachionus plicatilis]
MDLCCSLLITLNLITVRTLMLFYSLFDLKINIKIILVIVKKKLKDMGQSVILVDLDALIPNICVFFVLEKSEESENNSIKSKKSLSEMSSSFKIVSSFSKLSCLLQSKQKL